MPRDGSRIEPHFESDEIWTEEALKPLSIGGAVRTPLSRDSLSRAPRRRDRMMLAILSALAVLGSAAVLVAALML